MLNPSGALVFGIALLLSSPALGSCQDLLKGMFVEEMVKEHSKELVIRVRDGVALSGTLTLPQDAHTLLIPVHGSFVQTRDGAMDQSVHFMFPRGQVPQRNLFKEIAEIAFAEGVATFRYDKRASGKSGGDYRETTLVTLAQDLIDVVRYLRSTFPHIKIGVVGQSEGGLTSMIAHELGLRPDFFILQGAALEPFDVAFEFQKGQGAKPFLENKDGKMSELYPYIFAFYRDLNENGPLLQAMRDPNGPKYYKLKVGEWEYVTNLDKYRQYLWDGLQMLEKVEVPVLLVMGTQDTNVRIHPALEVQRRQKENGDFSSVEVVILEGLEHSFREKVEGEGVLDAMARPVSDKYKVVVRRYLRGVRQ